VELWRERALVIGRTFRAHWRHHSLIDTAAALTFFGLLSLFPFLIFLISLASQLLDPAFAQEVVESLEGVAPQDVIEIVGAEIGSLVTGPSTSLLTVSFIGAFWAASGGVTAMIRALNRANGIVESRPYWKVRGLAIVTTAAVALVSMIAGLIVLAIPALPETWISEGLLWLRLPIAGVLMMLIWALCYHVLPDTTGKLRLITPGSVVGVIIWVLASWGFSLYVSNLGNYDVTYGALGSVVVLLVWMWISSFVLVLGAELNVAWDRAYREVRPRGG